MLASEKDREDREALSDDKDPLEVLLDTPEAVKDIPKEISEVGGSHDPTTCSKVPAPAQNEPFVTVTASSGKVVDPSLLKAWASMPVLTLAEPVSIDGSYLGSDKRFGGGAFVTEKCKENTGIDLKVRGFTCMPVPITSTAEFMSVDKRPIATPPAPYIPNAAANRSVKVLKNFWGDETDVTDESNSEPDPIVASASGRSKYLEDNLAKARAAKASKKKRRQKSPGSAQGGEASIIKTRSKSQILSINSQ